MAPSGRQARSCRADTEPSRGSFLKSNPRCIHAAWNSNRRALPEQGSRAYEGSECCALSMRLNSRSSPRCMELEPACAAGTRVARSGGQARSCRADTESSCGWFREVKRVRRKSGGCQTPGPRQVRSCRADTEASCGSSRKSNPRGGSQGGVRPPVPPLASVQVSS